MAGDSSFTERSPSCHQPNIRNCRPKRISAAIASLRCFFVMNKAHSAIWCDAKRSNEWAGDAFVRYRVTDLKKSDRKRVKKYVPFSLIAHAMLLGLFLPRNVLECGGNQHLPSLPMGVFFWLSSLKRLSLFLVIFSFLSLSSGKKVISLCFTRLR